MLGVLLVSVLNLRFEFNRFGYFGLARRLLELGLPSNDFLRFSLALAGATRSIVLCRQIHIAREAQQHKGWSEHDENVQRPRKL